VKIVFFGITFWRAAFWLLAGFLGGRLMILWGRIEWLRFMMGATEVGDSRGTFRGYTNDPVVQKR